MTPCPLLRAAAACAILATPALAAPPSWSSPAGPAGITFSIFEDGPICLLPHQTPAGPRLYVGGEFTAVSGVPFRSLAAWDGAHWSGVSGIVSGVGGERVSALTVMPIDGTPRIIVAGFFDAPQTLDGLGYIDDQNTIRGFTRSPVSPHAWYGGAFAWNAPSGPELILSSGIFPQGSDYAYRYTPPSALGAGGFGLLPPGVITVTTAYAVFDDGLGDGPVLFIGVPMVGAAFSQVITRWNGTTLSSAPATQISWVNALCVHDDGSGDGPTLYAGGNGFRRYHAGAWQTIPGSPTSGIEAMASFDDGSGPAIYVAGRFGSVAGVPANNIVRLRNGAWEPVGSGLTGGGSGAGPGVNALAVFDEDGPGPRRPALYAVGKFTQAGGASAIGIARWGTPICRADINADEAVTVQDIFDFLAAYFAASPLAEFDGQPGLSTQDIFDFLAAYFTGCT